MFLGYFNFTAAYTAANKDLNALIDVLKLCGGYQFVGTTCTNSSFDFFQPAKGGGAWWFTEFGTYKNPKLPTKKRDLEAILYAYYPRKKQQQIQILTNLGYGDFWESSTSASQTPKNNTASAQNLTAQPAETQNLAPSQTPIQNVASPSTNPNTSSINWNKYEFWSSKIGADLLAYFEQKTGCGDVNFLRKHGIKPAKPQYCKFQYLAKSRGLGMMRKVEPTNKQTKRAYRVGDWSKSPETSYLFGYELLPKQPKKTDKLIFCEGQTDVICGNFHLNAHGFYFVSGGSATNGGLSDADARNLKSLFSNNNISVLWDNDKAGEKSADFADKHGFVWIDAKAFFRGGTVKDICDLRGKICAMMPNNSPKVQREGVTDMLLFRFEESTKKRPVYYAIPEIEGDRFSIGVKRAIRHDFNQYLAKETDSLERIIKYTELFPRILLESPPGTGKTWLVASLLEELITKTCKFDRIVFYVPTIALGQQLINDEAFEDTVNKGEALFICGETSQTDIREKFTLVKLCVITFDSSANLPLSFWDKTLLVVDEAHQIGTDYDYRKSPMRAVWGVLGNPLQPAICLSGTAEYLYTTNLCEGYNFQLIKGFPKITNDVHIKGKLYDREEIKRYEIVTHIQQNRPKTGTTLLKINSKSNLELWGKDLAKKGLSNSIVYSNDAKGGIRRTGNLDYRSIIQQGKLFIKETDVLATTCLLEAGVSLKFPIPLVVAVDTPFWAGNMQFSTRPRMYSDPNTGADVNKLVEFWMFFTNAQNKKTAHTGERKTELFKFHYQKAQQFCKELNALPLDTRKDQLKELRASNTFKEKFIFEKDKSEAEYDNILEVDVPAIEHFLIGLEVASSTPEQVINRICARDSRYIFAGFEQVIPTENSELAQLKDEANKQREKTKLAFFNLLGSDFTATLEALALTADKSYKTELLNYLNIPTFSKEQKNQIREFAEQNKEALAQTDKAKLACQIVQCIKLGCTVVEGIEKVAGGKYDPNDFERISLKRLHTLAKTSPQTLTRKEKSVITTHSAFQKVFDKLMYSQTSKHTAPQTLEQLTARLNETLNPHINRLYTENKAFDFIRCFYEIKASKVNENGIRSYKYTLVSAYDLDAIEAKTVPIAQAKTK